MKYVIFSIILLTLVALIIDKRNQKEHFQDGNGEQDETLSNLLNSINKLIIWSLKKCPASSIIISKLLENFSIIFFCIESSSDEFT